MIIDFKFNEYAREFAIQHGYGGGEHGIHGMWDMRDEMTSFTVAAGFGLIETPSGPLEAYQIYGYYGCECSERVIQVNSETAFQAFETAGVEAREWRGYVAFDASSRVGLRIAREISGALFGSPILDEDRHDDLEWEQALNYIEELVDLPDHVDAGGVINELPEVPHCGNCTPIDESDVLDALENMGYQQCADCSTVLDTDLEEAVCYECAEDYEVCEGECSSVVVEANYIYGFMSRTELESIKCECECNGLCEPCYEKKFPYARS